MEMKLRTPRTEIPPSTWSRDMLKLFHPMMFAPILMLVTIGTFLSNEVNYFVYFIELAGVIAFVISVYHFDDLIEKVTAPNVPEAHNQAVYAMGLAIGVVVGIYLLLTVSLILVVPMFTALILGIGYNLDVKVLKNKIAYSIVWGGTPVFGSYMVQTGTWPNLTVMVFTVFAMLLSVKLFWAWSIRTCGRASLCSKVIKKGYMYESDVIQYCHSPHTLNCLARQQVPKEVNQTVKILQRLDLLILFMLMWGVILW